MPAKLILPVVVGIAVAIHLYQNDELRHKLTDLYSTSRRKLATAIHQLADHISPQQQKGVPMEPMPGRAPSPPVGSPSPSFDTTAPRRRDVHADDNGPVWSSGYEMAEQERVLLSGGGSEDSESESLAGSGGKTPTSARSVRSGTLEGEVKAQEKPLPEVPSESGYETAQNSAAAGVAQPYWSIHEWATNTTSPGSSVRGDFEEVGEGSVVGVDEGSDGESTVGSWTEVGSGSERGM